VSNLRRIVVDASVVSKWVIQEPLTEKALKIREKSASEDLELIAPSVMLYDFCHILSRHPAKTPEDIERDLNAVLQFNIKLEDVRNPEFLRKAVEVAKSTKLTFVEAAYVALSKSYGCPLVTADSKLAEKLKDKIEVIELKDWEG